MWVSCGKILYLYFGKPIVSVSYSCVISYSKTQLFRTESIYYGSWVHRLAWYLSWSESDSTDLSCPCSCVCDYLVVSCGLAGLGWPHVSRDLCWEMTQHQFHHILLATSNHKDSPNSKNSSTKWWEELENHIAKGMDRDEWRTRKIFAFIYCIGFFTKM